MHMMDDEEGETPKGAPPKGKGKDDEKIAHVRKGRWMKKKGKK